MNNSEDNKVEPNRGTPRASYGGIFTLMVVHAVNLVLGRQRDWKMDASFDSFFKLWFKDYIQQ